MCRRICLKKEAQFSDSNKDCLMCVSLLKQQQLKKTSKVQWVTNTLSDSK